MMRPLHRECIHRESLKAQLGPRFDLKRFHEKFLGYGNAPVAIIKPLVRPEDVSVPAVPAAK
ncbi:MAG: hypothetical protein ACREVL_14010 [Solimonas sp.]